MKIPNKNNLPNTILNLQKELSFSLTLAGARDVESIGFIKIGQEPKVENGIRYPYYLIDFHGKDRIIGRSREIYSRRNMEKIFRVSQRKLAVFLFENKNN